jgi:hypothetical protein
MFLGLAANGAPALRRLCLSSLRGVTANGMKVRGKEKGWAMEEEEAPRQLP